MARLHVIYDRDGILQTTHENMPKEKFKIAVIDIAEDVQPEDFAKLAEHLSELLLEQFADGSK